MHFTIVYDPYFDDTKIYLPMLAFQTVLSIGVGVIAKEVIMKVFDWMTCLQSVDPLDKSMRDF